MTNSIETVAIAKAINSKDAKAARKDLTVGTHKVDTVVRVSGDLVVGKDSEVAATCSILNKDFMILVMQHAGITREHAAKVISEVAEGYLVDWTGSKEDKKAAKEARKEAVAKYDPEGKVAGVFEDLTASLPNVPRKGKVSFKGVVEVVEQGTGMVVEDEAAELVAVA